MRISDRYGSAINTSDLRNQVDRPLGNDADILGAYAFAAKMMRQRSKDPDPALAVALERLFMGDNKAAGEITERLCEMAFKKSRKLDIKIKRLEVGDMARACLAWHRDGVCKPCGGHGKVKIPGTPQLGSNDCQVCRGSGKIIFHWQFKVEWRPLANYLLAEMERAQALAGPNAMKKLGGSLDL
jgi:hypothetical protein